MTTLAEHIIVAGAENRPPMLEKSMYDSWASCIRLFIKGNKHGRMMLDSINNGPLVYSTVEENGQTRPKKYSELTEAQQLQDDCDVQAKNIILHGLPPDVYALVNHQEAFAHVPGETLYEYYWRFSQLINDMHTNGMTMQQVQVNTKFLITLPSEWSKFVTDVKLAKSLYTTNYDQLYAYLSQHERHANEVRISHERYPDSLAFVANSPTLYNPSQSPQHSGYSILVVPMFQQGEDLIECINKAMTFLSAVASRFPPSNNQLRTSSNPRNQATIQDGRVTVQQVEGRQNKSYAGTRNRGIATTSKVNFVAGPPRVVKCYNCQGEGHIERWCTQPKRPRNAAWFKEKLILAEAQEAGQILDEEKLAFLADLDCDDLSSAKVVLMENLSSYDPEVLSKVPYSDSYPKDMINQDVQEIHYFEQTHVDDFEDNEIHSGSNIILYSQYLQESQDAVIQDTDPSAPNDLFVLSLVEQMTDHIAHLDKENQTNKMDIDTLKETLSNNVKEKESLSKTLIVFITESKKKNLTMHMLTKPQVFYDDTHKQALGYQNPFHLKRAQWIQPTLYDGSVIAKEHAVISVIDDEETLILE
ncbi:copia protein [Tanacetum coccineum]